MPQKTKIEWCRNPDGSQGFTSNPIRGKCLHNCSYCYAEKIRRFRRQPEHIQPFPGELEAIQRRKKPATYFMGSMHDLFGEWIPTNLIRKFIRTACDCKRHTFLFLTKNPRRYSEFNFPQNCWTGYSDDGLQDKNFEWEYLHANAGGRFISFEPLIGNKCGTNFSTVDWIIIGAETKNGKPVDHGNANIVRMLIAKAEETETPIFVKDSIYKLYPDLPKRRQLPYLRKEK